MTESLMERSALPKGGVQVWLDLTMDRNEDGPLEERLNASPVRIGALRRGIPSCP